MWSLRVILLSVMVFSGFSGEGSEKKSRLGYIETVEIVFFFKITSKHNISSTFSLVIPVFPESKNM